MPYLDRFLRECVEERVPGAAAAAAAAADDKQQLTILQMKGAFYEWCIAQGIPVEATDSVPAPWASFYQDGRYAELLLLQRYCQERIGEDVYLPHLRLRAPESSAAPASSNGAGESIKQAAAPSTASKNTKKKRKGDHQSAPVTTAETSKPSDGDEAGPSKRHQT